MLENIRSFSFKKRFKEEFTVIIFSSLALVYSYFLEYYLHFPPCILCSLQRAMYTLLLFFTLGRLVSKRKFLMPFCLAICTMLAATALFHFLVEVSWLPELCSSSFSVFLSPSHACRLNPKFLGIIPLPLLNLMACPFLFHLSKKKEQKKDA